MRIKPWAVCAYGFLFWKKIFAGGIKMNLGTIGLTDKVRNDFELIKMNEDIILGRVALEHKHMYRVWTEQGEL